MNSALRFVVLRRANCKILLAAALLLMPFSQGGCVSIARAAMFKIVDVTDKPELHGGLILGEVYRTEVPLFLQNDQDIGHEKILVTPGELGVVGGMEYSGPYSAEKYKEDRAAWPQVVGGVALGTRLEVSAVRMVNTAFDAGWTYPVVTIVDGEFKGEQANIIDLVMKCEEYDPKVVITCCPDERLLRPVEEESLEE